MKLVSLTILILLALPPGAAQIEITPAPGRISPECGIMGGEQVTILGYDSGIVGYSICWYEGDDHWVANDFTLGDGGREVFSMLIATRKDWPDYGFDGFYVAIFGDMDGLPGAMVWPETGPKYVSGDEIEGTFDGIWVEVGVEADIEQNRIYAAMEQYYNYPNSDPYCVDNNPVDREHSWEKAGSIWERMDTGDLGAITNNNLMLRLSVESKKSLITSSLGSIKAMYK